MIYYVIPAKRDSEGFPFKNRKLFENTIKTIPDKYKKNVIVTTNDQVILDHSAYHGVKAIYRNNENSGLNIHTHTSSMKDVLTDVVHFCDLNDNDIIVMLYLTYPQRTWEDIQKAIDYFNIANATSLLCRKKPKTHPYLCIYNDGKQIIKHNEYRRQDYPEVWEISHFIQIAYVFELYRLNKNLYNDYTVYMTIEDKIDVDYEKDLRELK